MKFFNSIQAVLIFMLFPLLIGWLRNEEIQDNWWAVPGFWAALVAYLVSAGFMVSAVYLAITSEDERKWM